MVQRFYSKCNMCDKITMIKYQVGYADFPVVYVCPCCLTEIRGFCKNEVEKARVNLNFENATIINKMVVPDFFLCVSRELPTFPIKSYEESDDLSISPFMFYSSKLFNLDDSSNWKRVGRFCEKETEKIDRVFDYLKLLSNEKYEILARKLRLDMPVEYFPLNNHSEICRGVHTYFVGIISDILPNKWMEDTNIFQKIVDVHEKNQKEVNGFINEFECSGEFQRWEKKLIDVLECFVSLVPGIIPAYLALDLKDDDFDPSRLIMSTVSFESLLDFYQKSYETILDVSDMLVALNNIFYRGDFEKLPEKINLSFREKRKQTNQFNKVKDCLVETECFSEIIISAQHNRIRNSIGHFSTDFNGITQKIHFIDIYKGEKREEILSLFEFAVLCIDNFQTCFYLFEILYHLRKWHLILNGDLPFFPKFNERPIKKNKISRNEPCPCGSGKKYKKCCGR